MDGQANANDLGSKALWYAENFGWAVFPLVPRTKDPFGGSHGFKDAAKDPDTIKAWWQRQPQSNIGIATGAASGGLLVIDLDSHGKGDGFKTLASWQKEHNTTLPDTATVTTGTGGRHLYYKVDHVLPVSKNELLGVDIRCDGGYVVAPPSIHPNGKPYTWDEWHDIAEANADVFDFVAHVRPKKSAMQVVKGGSGKLEKGGRNDNLFRIACSLRGSGKERGEILNELVRINSEKCNPPLSQNELEKIATSAARYATKTSSVLELADRMLDDEILSRGLGYNDLMGAPWKRGALPWDSSPVRRRWDDSDAVQLWAYAQACLGAKSKDATNDAAIVVQQRNHFDPLLEMLESLPSWDGTRRIGTVFHEYLGAYDAYGGRYVRAVETLWFRGAVTRAFRPGCKFDAVIVLIGAQGIGKSQILGKLARVDDFYSDAMPSMDDPKKFGEALLGKWIVELGELASMRKSDIESAKATLSRQADRFRPAYGRHAVDYPRRAVFAGTTNEQGFLADETGARRFLPITCAGWQRSGVPCANPAIFAADFDATVQQIWAEAVDMYKRDPDAPLVLDAETDSMLRAIQRSHRTDSPIRDAVLAWLDNKAPDKICAQMVISAALGTDVLRGQATGRLIGQIIDATGEWTRCSSVRIEGYGTQRGWKRKQMQTVVNEQDSIC